MWSYYASGHVGVCIRFKVEENFQHIIDENLNDDPLMNLTQYEFGPSLIFQRVLYEKYPFILTADTFKHYQNIFPEYENLFKKNNIKSSPLDLLTICEVTSRKPICWKHEKEYRLIALGGIVST